MRAVPRIPYPVYRSTTGETERDVFGSQGRNAAQTRRWLAQLRKRRVDAHGLVSGGNWPSIEGGLP